MGCRATRILGNRNRDNLRQSESGQLESGQFLGNQNLPMRGCRNKSNPTRGHSEWAIGIGVFRIRTMRGNRNLEQSETGQSGQSAFDGGNHIQLWRLGAFTSCIFTGAYTDLGSRGISPFNSPFHMYMVLLLIGFSTSQDCFLIQVNSSSTGKNGRQFADDII